MYFKIILILTLTFFSGCKSSFDDITPGRGSADFSRTISIGGNFLSGYQDGALFRHGQERSIPALLAGQFKTAGGGDFIHPLMPDDKGLGLTFKGWSDPFQGKSNLGYKTDCEGVTSLSPLKDTFGLAAAGIYLDRIVATSFNDFTVPFAGIKDLLDPAFSRSYADGNQNPYYHRFASNPDTSTLISDAINQPFTFFILWAGMEEIYNYASRGGTTSKPMVSPIFETYLDIILSRLTASGAKGVLANIPDISAFPFYTLINPRGVELTQEKADSLNMVNGNLFNYSEGANGFIIEDPNAAYGYRQMNASEVVLLSVPVDSLKCNFLGVFLPLPDRYVLDAYEVETIIKAIEGYNEVINKKVEQFNIPVVDMNKFFNTLKVGIYIDGVEYNSEFVSGGFYGLDGYHPNEKGYGILANEFIATINRHYGSTVPLTLCDGCKGIIFP
ncbi:MAG: SGNH/GDSL hydrolase family protein [Bacteroidetes bacterium]|nr:SGNH/GDSL hydrolase family protein [Bacteroidota bacterium]